MEVNEEISSLERKIALLESRIIIEQDNISNLIYKHLIGKQCSCGCTDSIHKIDCIVLKDYYI